MRVLRVKSVDVDVQTETALVHDAVQVFAAALRSLDSSQEISLQPLSCSGENTWQHGNSLINYMKMMEIRGLTGLVKFDQYGLRTDFTLDIVELHKSGLEKVGTWHDRFGIEFDRLTSLKSSEPKKTIENKTIVVTTIKVSRFHLHNSYHVFISLRRMLCLKSLQRDCLEMKHSKASVWN